MSNLTPAYKSHGMWTADELLHVISVWKNLHFYINIILYTHMYLASVFEYIYVCFACKIYTCMYCKIFDCYQIKNKYKYNINV